MTTIVSANGAGIPAIGLGTWQLNGDTALRCVEVALKAGYRHIDTAAMYGNEREIGEAIRRSGVRRDDIFLTTKVWYDQVAFGALQRSAEESLKRLKCEYVDLLLIHWPSKTVSVEEQVRALGDARRRGLARHIGLANFPPYLVEEAVSHADQPLVSDQVEHHPYLDQSELKATLAAHGMSLTSYSPLGKGSLLDDPVIVEIAREHGKSPAQVILRWHVQQPKTIAIPRSSNPRRIADNIEIFDFALSAEEMARLSGLARSNGRMLDPSFGPDWRRTTSQKDAATA
jgi:diketogulonate reductase-like aldo/keto reductase